MSEVSKSVVAAPVVNVYDLEERMDELAREVESNPVLSNDYKIGFADAVTSVKLASSESVWHDAKEHPDTADVVLALREEGPSLVVCLAFYSRVCGWQTANSGRIVAWTEIPDWEDE